MRFDLESLQVLVPVIEGGSLAAVSEWQHIVSSAISRRITELKSNVGTALLYRHGRGVEPTPAGSALYYRAKRLIDQMQEISSKTNEYAQGMRGHVRIHVNFSIMVQYLPGDLPSFLSTSPDAKIDPAEKSSSQAPCSVEAGTANIGICSQPGAAPGLEVRPYHVDRLVLIVLHDHPTGMARHLCFADTLNYDYVSMPLGASISTLCAQNAKQAGKQHKVRTQVTNFEGLRNMVAADLGTGLLPKASVKPYLRNSTLCMVELDEAWVQRPLPVITRGYAALPVLTWLLIDHLVSQASAENQRDPSGPEKAHALILQLRAGYLRNILQFQHMSSTGNAVALDDQEKGVFIQEVITHDDFQTEPHTVPTQDKIALVDRLSQCGLSKTEVTLFISSKVILTLTDVEDVMRDITRVPGVTYVALVSNMRGAERVVDCNVDELNLVMSVSETHNLANLRMTPGQSFQQAAQVAVTFRSSRTSPNLSLSCVFGCPMGDQISADTVLTWVARVAETGIDGITLCDTTGMVWPSQMFVLCSVFRLALPQTALTVRLHNTCGMVLANILTALQAGANRFDGALGGLGGCPYAPGASGNVCTEDAVYMLELLNYDTGTDLGALLEVPRLLPGLIGHDTNDQVAKAGHIHDLHPAPDYVETARQHALSKASV